MARYVLPVIVLLGFVGLFLHSAGDYFATKVKVQVAPVEMQKGVIQKAGIPVFQAAGWIEPRPTATSVSSLNSGVLEELLVVEGQEVKKGMLIGRLNSEDARLALKDARSVVDQAKASVRQVAAERDAAQTRRDRPVHLDVMIGQAKGDLAEVKTQLAQLPFLLEAAQADRKYQQASYDGKKAAGSAIPGVVLEQSKSGLASADAKVRELMQRDSSLLTQVGALESKLDALKIQRSLLIEENRQLGEAEAKVLLAKSVLDQKKILLEKAQLDFDRTELRAPVAGRVLRLVAFPGDRVVGVTSGGDGNSAVVELYQPSKLQVRADVRLEDVPKVLRGQEVLIETASSNTKLRGKVLQVNSKANIQKNTLQVKVAILDPPPVVRPEMLVTAVFLSMKMVGTSAKKESSRSLFLVPEKHVKTEGDQSFLWIVGPNKRAIRQKVTLAGQAEGQFVLVSDGLKVTDKLIVQSSEPLAEGVRIELGQD